MNPHWEVKAFEDCIEKVNYTNKIQRKDFLESGKYPIISQEQDYINGYWDNSQDVFRIIKPVIVFGDHTQVLKYIDFDFVLGADGVKILQPINNLDSKFFYYFLRGLTLKNLGYARHYRLLKENMVPIPPLTEQKRIVAILDEAFEGIAKAKESAEKNLKNAKEIFESYSEMAFSNPGTWDNKTLGEVCSLFQGVAINAKTKHILVEKSDLPLLRIKDLITDNVEQYVDPNNYPKNALISETDLIYTRTGQVGLVFTGKKGVLHNNSFKIEPAHTLSKEYLFYWLQNPIFKSKIIALSSRAAQPDITHTLFKEQKIAIPPLPEQKSIVKKLDGLSAETKKLSSIYEKKLADLEELKQSLLQKAFKGELLPYHYE